MQSENRLTAILNRKPSKSVQGFELDLHGQNPVALLLAPPPLPTGQHSCQWSSGWEFNSCQD